MKDMGLVLAIVCLAFSSCAGDADENAGIIPGGSKDFINGDPPDRSVSAWIRFNLISGSLDAAPPIVWLSPDPYLKQRPEYWIQVDPESYGRISAISRSYRCPIKFGEDPGPDVIQISEYTDGDTIDYICWTSPQASCALLREVIPILNVKTEEYLSPLNRLFNRVHCNP